MAVNRADVSVGPPRNDAEIADFMRIISQALFFPGDGHDTFLKREGPENLTVARIGDSVAGGLSVQPMGISFGGLAVPMAAVRIVGVAPEYRSKGVGAALMDAALRDSFNKGLALSVLYPATIPFYRRTGYELAGSHTTYRHPIGAIAAPGRLLDVRPATAGDLPILTKLYRRRLTRCPGNLDRNNWAWQRIVDPISWWPKTYGYIVEDDNDPAGYIYFAHKSGKSFHDNTLSIADMCWETEAAGTALLALLADHRSMVVAFEYGGAPADPLSLLLHENTIEKFTRMDWMLRIVDVHRALELRGYPLGQSAELHLEVVEDLAIPENCGRFILSTADGRAAVRAGGDGRLGVSIRDLAPLYSGFLSAPALRAAGRLRGDDESIALASRIFAGPIPWMSDTF